MNEPQNSLLKIEGECGTIEPLQASLPPERESNMKGHNSKITALYSRLSKDDLLTGESQSISNQKLDLERYAKEHNFANPRHYSEACDIIEPTQRILINQGFWRVGSNFIL
ncbi:hypothetical protein FACS1894208_09990 [Clostridia bacterium]|nr:hypothetical protein FACS1894208_09990 [Clostridia bacterium]